MLITGPLGMKGALKQHGWNRLYSEVGALILLVIEAACMALQTKTLGP